MRGESSSRSRPSSIGPQGYASLGAVIESLLAGIPPDKRVREEIVAAGPAQQINLKKRVSLN
ncbi:MAG: hypothetical protein ABSH42_03365 [Bryobacteraceae bacterium]